MIFSHWLYFIAAFAIVVGLLSLAMWLSEWWKWRRDQRSL